MQRMKSEQSCNGCTSPSGASRLFEKKEKEQCISDMEDHIHEQVAACVQTEDLTVNHVSNPGDRMPVGSMKGRECPDQAVEGNAGVNHVIVANVDIVVQADKLVIDHLDV